MKNALVIFAVSIVLAPVLARAAEEFDGAVPVDLAKLFLNLPEQGGLYRDLPEDFPLQTVPEGFEVLGTVDQQYTRAVYFETSLEMEAAEDAIAEALAPAGWLRLPSPQPRPALGIRGFVVGQGETRFPLQLCHEAEGTLQVAPASAQDRQVVSVRQNLFSQPQQRSCRQQIEDNERFAVARAMPGGSLGEYMPRLELPREADFMGRRAGPVGGFSGGGNEAETRTDLSIDWEPARIYAHFEEQLAAQGWMQDGQWATGRVAGGSWIREADGVDLLGLLSIVRREEGQHHLRFRLLSLGDD